MGPANAGPFYIINIIKTMKILKLSEYINETSVYVPGPDEAKWRKITHYSAEISDDTRLNAIQEDALTHCVEGAYFYGYEDAVPVTHETFKLLYADYDPDDLLTFVDNYLNEHGFEWCYPHNEDAVNPNPKYHLSHHPKWNLKELNDACGI